jgi:hypothetical protein
LAALAISCALAIMQQNLYSSAVPANITTGALTRAAHPGTSLNSLVCGYQAATTATWSVNAVGP